MQVAETVGIEPVEPAAHSRSSLRERRQQAQHEREKAEFDRIVAEAMAEFKAS